ncbi:DNA ligase D [Salimicrobium halophilum]|uniref:DNA ligase (ATP) n=1 Tax=Salimicrobium halophilum TaxID=86666 RepID=A0A1G8QVK5_9BACI|nr:DNA ligase D [Salimicrobium halophilum]SDJ08762.1 bifunctional non-homologous end joining protein LigD [Salimicrobium halophilum]
MEKPMKMTLVNEAPQGEEWVYEVKYDGFRALLEWSEQRVRLMSRNGKDLSDRFPEITSLAEISPPPSEPVTLDGELVILNTPYQSNFPLLQQRGRLRNEKKIRDAALSRPATFIAFDYISDPVLPYTKRRKLLEAFVLSLSSERLALIKSFEDWEEIRNLVFTHRGEGIIAKAKQSRYTYGKRTSDWKKIKNWRHVSGFLTSFTPENDYYGLGVWDRNSPLPLGKFKHGLNEEEAQTLRTFFMNKGVQKGKVWTLEPSVCVDVTCLHAEEGELREPSFHQFRFDMKAEDCTIEKVEWDLAQFPENVDFSHTGKNLWPGVTKRDYMHYLRKIAPYMLPFLKDKKLTLIRYPDGIDETSFYQKHLPDHAPDYVEAFVEKGESFILCPSLSPLLWLGNQGALEFHIPFQKAGAEEPDEIVFDLDPPDRDRFPDVIFAARLLKHLLDELKVYSFVKTSGNKGMQVHIPIEEGTMTYEETRKFTEAIVTLMVWQYPDLFTIERLKKNRGGRLYLDYVQHAEGKTIIAPYSTRATEQATIATPLFWEEVEEGLRPEQFTLPTIMERVETFGDPFADFHRVKGLQPVDIMKKLKG